MELTLFLDHACNLRCSYCYGGTKLSRPMPTAVMRRAVDLALAQSPPTVTISFFGGEPLLHVDLVEETMAYVEDRMTQSRLPRVPLGYVMNTNGTIVDERVLSLLAPPRRMGVFVSLDGPADLHDRNRVGCTGRGSHAQVVANLARLRSQRIPYSLRERCQSHCGCQQWHLTGELGRIDATLCEIEEAFITAADQASAALFAEACPTFIATYYRKRYQPVAGASLGRMRDSSRR